MSEIIPNYPFSALKKLNASQIKRLKSCEITSDGVYLFTFVNPTTDFIRQDAENKGQLSNSQGLETLEEILKEEE